MSQSILWATLRISMSSYRKMVLVGLLDLSDNVTLTTKWELHASLYYILLVSYSILISFLRSWYLHVLAFLVPVMWFLLQNWSMHRHGTFPGLLLRGMNLLEYVLCSVSLLSTCLCWQQLAIFLILYHVHRQLLLYESFGSNLAQDFFNIFTFFLAVLFVLHFAYACPSILTSQFLLQ